MSIRNVLTTCLVLVAVLAAPTSALADGGEEPNTFNVRAVLPQANLDLGNGVQVIIAGSNGFAFLHDGNALDVHAHTTPSGKIAYVAAPFAGSDSDLLTISGTINVLPDGSPRVEFDMQFSNGFEPSGAVYTVAGVLTMAQTCDCEDKIDMGCDVNECGAGSKCNAAKKVKCKWFPAVASLD